MLGSKNVWVGIFAEIIMSGSIHHNSAGMKVQNNEHHFSDRNRLSRMKEFVKNESSYLAYSIFFNNLLDFA